MSWLKKLLLTSTLDSVEIFAALSKKSSSNLGEMKDCNKILKFIKKMNENIVSLLISQEKKIKIKALTEEISSKIQQINFLIQDDDDVEIKEQDDDAGNTNSDEPSDLIGEIIKLKTSLENWKQSTSGKISRGLDDDEYYKARDTVFELDECRMNLGKEIIKTIVKRIPTEVIRHIILFLDPIDIYQSASQVSRDWLKICENLQLSANLVRKIPVLRLNLKKFCNSPLVGRTLTKLDLSYNNIFDEDVKAITQSKELKNLTSLILYNNELSAKGAEYIAKSNILSNLTELDLDFNNLQDVGLECIANSHYMSKLTALKAGDCGLSPESIATVCSKLKLKKFGIFLNECFVDGLRPICESPKLSKLTDLNIGCTMIEDKGMKILLSSNNISNLTTLNIACNEMSDVSLILLSNCNKLSNLTDLDIGENDFTVKGMKALCESKFITKLLSLKAKDLKIGDTGLASLASSANMRNLTHLNLQSQPFTEDAMKVFAQSKTFSNLAYLNMYGIPCNAGVRFIVQSKFLSKLTYLNISSCTISDETVLRYFNTMELPKLKILEMEGNKMTRKGIQFIANDKRLSKISEIYLARNGTDPKNDRFFSQYPFIRMDRYWED